MNLLQIRQKFIKETGRFDLVVDLTDYADNGANEFIRAGQRYLDRRQDNPKSISRYQLDLTAGKHKIEGLYIRTIDKVEVFDSEGRSDVVFKDYDWMRKNYDLPIAQQDRGRPLYWTWLANQAAPQQKDLLLINFDDEYTYDWEDMRLSIGTPSESIDYDGISLRPVLDKTYTVILHGRFESLLSADTDVSYHSVRYPDILVLAAKMALYAQYDNQQGIADCRTAMDIWLDEMDKDMIRREITVGGQARKGL